MSLIAELLSLRETQILTEAQLQSIVKKFSVPVGSFQNVFGDFVGQATELLGTSTTDPVYELKGTDPQAVSAIKSLVSQAFGDGTRVDDNEMKIVSLIGSRKVLVWNNRVLTSKEQFDSLVESTSEDDVFKHPLTGKVSTAFNGYLSPFTSSHRWVSDAKRVNVCEAQDKTTAQTICDLLNEKYPHKSK